MSDRICGAIGCRNDAIGKLERDDGFDVWTCQSCASKRGMIDVAYE